MTLTILRRKFYSNLVAILCAFFLNKRFPPQKKKKTKKIMQIRCIFFYSNVDPKIEFEILHLVKKAIMKHHSISKIWIFVAKLLNIPLLKKIKIHNKNRLLKQQNKQTKTQNKTKKLLFFSHQTYSLNCHSVRTRIPILVKKKYLKVWIALYLNIYKAKMAEFNLCKLSFFLFVCFCFLFFVCFPFYLQKQGVNLAVDFSKI